MWREYAEAVLFKAGQFTPKHVAFISNAFARAEVPDRDVFRRLADRAVEKVEEFEPRDIGLMLNAYAKLAFRDLVVFEKFAKFIYSSPSGHDGFGEQQLALIANAYARLQLLDKRLFETLSLWITRQADLFTPQGLAMVKNAYAKVLMRDTEMFKVLMPGVGRHLQVFSPQHIANLLNAYARLEMRDDAVLEQLASRVPDHVQDFRPVEVAAVAGALTKLGVNNRRALNAIAAVVRERGRQFRARQLASSLHAFSSLTVTYASLFTDSVPHVLACAPDADSQGLVMLFCAYARAGQPETRVVRTLIDFMEPQVDMLDPKVHVNLFYACGRLALHKEPFAQQLAGCLLPVAHTLQPQHTSNCLFASARLGLSSEVVSRLVAALQAHLARGGVALEPQQCANALFALATLHRSSGARQGFPAPRPDGAIEAVVDRVLQNGGTGEWASRPQLVASVCGSCARLGVAPAPLFALASRVVRAAEKRPGAGGGGVRLSMLAIADLVASFAAVGLFDVDLFSWALSNLSSNEPGVTIPMDALLRTIEALDYGGHTLAAPQSGSSRTSSQEDTSIGFLFPDFPTAFQQQVRGFYAMVGHEFLVRATLLPAADLTRAAPAFARAGLLSSLPPFDLLSPAYRGSIQAAATAKPPPEPFGGSQAQPFDVRHEEAANALEVDRADSGALAASQALAVEARTALVDEVAHEETVLGRLLAELDAAAGSSSEEGERRAATGTSTARRLVRYTAMLQSNARNPATASATQRVTAVPGPVLDPIVRRLSDELVSHAGELAFGDIIVTVTALAGAGVQPRSAVAALQEAAESKFPEPPQAGNASAEDVAEATSNVAALLRNLGPAGLSACSSALHERFLDFSAGLARVASAATASESSTDGACALGERPLRTVATFIDALRHVGGQAGVAHADVQQGGMPWCEIVAESTGPLIAAALRLSLLPSMRAHAPEQADPDSCATSRQPDQDQASAARLEEFEDLAALLVSLLPPTAAESEEAAARHDLRRDAAAVAAFLLARLLRQRPEVPVHPPRLLELLRALDGAPLATLGACHLDLVAAAAERMSRGAQILGPGGIAASLQTFAHMRLFIALEQPELADVGAAATAALAAERRSRAACGLPPLPRNEELGMIAETPHIHAVQEIPRLAMALLRSLLTWVRRLAPNEAVQAARFCALTLEARALSEAERSEARDGLAQLLEQIAWERRRLSPEDLQIVAAIGILLRSEYPELLRRDAAWLSRSVLATLEELRSSGKGAHLVKL